MLNDPQDIPFESLSKLGLAITKTEHGKHCGILYKIEDEEPVLLHLAWHYTLICSPPTDRYFWANLDSFIDAEKRVIALHAREVGLKNADAIPYGIWSEGITFNSQGNVEGVGGGRGLTCATFVLAFFSSMQYDLLDGETWPEHANDEWQLQTAETLRRHGAEAGHVAAVESQVGVRRVSPDEIVGVGLSGAWPANYDDAIALALEIKDEVEQLLGRRAA